MKKSDIAMIILVAGVSALLAFTVANSLPMLRPAKEGVKIPTVATYKESVSDPDPELFNANAINPTVKTVIGSDAAQPAE